MDLPSNSEPGSHRPAAPAPPARLGQGTSHQVSVRWTCELWGTGRRGPACSNEGRFPRARGRHHPPARSFFLPEDLAFVAAHFSAPLMTRQSHTAVRTSLVATKEHPCCTPRKSSAPKLTIPSATTSAA